MSWTLITQLRGMQERECASLGDMADQTAGRAADALEREMQRAKAAEARVAELEAEALNGRHAVFTDLKAQLAAANEQNARLRDTLEEIKTRTDTGDAQRAMDDIYSIVKAALNGEEAST